MVHSHGMSGDSFKKVTPPSMPSGALCPSKKTTTRDNTKFQFCGVQGYTVYRRGAGNQAHSTRGDCCTVRVAAEGVTRQRKTVGTAWFAWHDDASTLGIPFCRPTKRLFSTECVRSISKTSRRLGARISIYSQQPATLNVLRDVRTGYSQAFRIDLDQVMSRSEGVANGGDRHLHTSGHPGVLA